MCMCIRVCVYQSIEDQQTKQGGILKITYAAIRCVAHTTGNLYLLHFLPVRWNGTSPPGSGVFVGLPFE